VVQLKTPASINKPIPKNIPQEESDEEEEVQPKTPISVNKPIPKNTSKKGSDEVVQPKTPVSFNKPVPKNTSKKESDEEEEVQPRTPISVNKPVPKNTSKKESDEVVQPKTPVSFNKPVPKNTPQKESDDEEVTQPKTLLPVKKSETTKVTQPPVTVTIPKKPTQDESEPDEDDAPKRVVILIKAPVRVPTPTVPMTEKTPTNKRTNNKASEVQIKKQKTSDDMDVTKSNSKAPDPKKVFSTPKTPKTPVHVEPVVSSGSDSDDHAEIIAKPQKTEPARAVRTNESILKSLSKSRNKN